jgi:hypothetical protein
VTSTLRVIEANLRTFRCAYARYEDSPVEHGALVAVREGMSTVFGVVSNIESGPQDPTRPLATRDQPGESADQILADNPELRPLLRTCVDIAICGHVRGEACVPSLPPAPPPLFARVEPASDDEIVRLAEGGRFLPLLVHAAGCDDATIAATCRAVMQAMAETERRGFAVVAGKELARILRAEPARLTTIIRSMYP